MTRILVLSNLYPPQAIGGYEWSCHDVMRRLAARGHDIEVLTTTTRFPDLADRPEVADFPVHRTLEWYWDDHRLVSPGLVERWRQEGRNQRRLRKHLDDLRPDVVSVWNVGALSHGLLRAVADRGTPMVYAVCDEWPVHGRSLDAWGRLFTARRRVARLAEVVLRVPCRAVDLGPSGAWCFVSEYTRAVCRSASPFSFPISSVVHSGIEVSDFPVVPERAGDGAFGWRLLYVGRLDERKGVLTAVDALAQLGPQASLTLVGRGDAADAVRARARDLGVEDRVTIAVAERSDLAAVYRAADAFLFTSEWAEPFGLTPLEAMACGTPVIGTGTGGSGEFLVDHQTCLRYPPGDAGSLADAVRRLADDPALRRRLSERGRLVAAQLTTDRLAETFEAWHVAAASGFSDGPPTDRALLTDGILGA